MRYVLSVPLPTCGLDLVLVVVAATVDNNGEQDEQDDDDDERVRINVHDCNLIMPPTNKLSVADLPGQLSAMSTC